MDADRLPPSHDERLREARAGTDHPDHPRDRGLTPTLADGQKSTHEIERGLLQRRIAREKAAVENNYVVAGHDFRREYQEREERGRGGRY